MKFNFNKVLSFILSFIILIGSFSYYSITAYALPKRLKDGTWIDVPVSEYGEEISYFIQYGVNQIGAVYNKDFETWLKNNDTYKDLYDDNGRLAKNISIDTETETVSYTEDIMSLLKSALDDYTKENEPYYIGTTYGLNTIDYFSFNNQKNIYDTVKNLLNDSPNGMIRFGTDSYKEVCLSVFPDLKDIGFVQRSGFSSYSVESYHFSTWKRTCVPAYYMTLAEDDPAISSLDDLKDRSIQTFEHPNNNIVFMNRFAGISTNSYIDDYLFTLNRYDISSSTLNLITYSPVRIRIYNTYADFQDASLGKRHVYYTSKYYDYTPAEISVSTKELEQGVKDLNTAMDKLLEQIDKDTPESDIENLLQQILDELRNNGGSGTGSEGPGTDPGTSGGSVDMSTTNSWLAKIYAKVCEIFDRMGQKDTPDQGSVSENSIGLSDINNVLKLIWANTNVIVEKLMPDDSISGDSVSGNSIDLSGTNSILDSIQAGLDDIHETLKKIKRWSAVDTVIDGVDAIADWFSLLHDILADADAGAESAVSSISSALGDAAGLMTKKFPFSIPWDLFFLISFFSAEPEVPHFEIPFSVPYYDFEYTFVVDFADYQWLSDVIRPILLMSYAIGLLSKTPSILSIGKEE